MLLLLKANANPNLRMHGQTDAISLVPNANAGLNLSAESGGTPLHLASQNGHTDSICLLLKAKANPNLQTDNGITALHLASHNGHATAIRLLLKAKADPNFQMRSGETPLILEVRMDTLMLSPCSGSQC